METADTASELALTSILRTSPDLILQAVGGGLRAECFSHPAARAFYAAATQLVLSGVSVTDASLLTKL